MQLDPFATVSDPNKALLGKLLAVPALRARYLGYVRDIAEKWLDWNRLGPLVERYHGLIAADVAADTRKLYTTEAFRTATFGEDPTAPTASSLRGFVEGRRAFLLSHPEVGGASRP